MARHHDSLRSDRGEVHFSWTENEDGTWSREQMWGWTTRTGARVEKSLGHLVTRSFASEDECRRALQRAARGWLHEHR